MVWVRYSRPQALCGGGNRATRGAPKYRRVSWDEAFTLLAGELARVKARYGNEATLGSVIGGWQSAGNSHTKPGQVGRFLSLYGGYTSLIGNKSYASWQWAAPYSWGQMYPDDSTADTLANTKTFIFWASDPMDNWKVHAPSYARVRNWLAAMKQRGIKMIVIDPLFTQTAEMADVWIPIRPGSDSALMAAMAYVMIRKPVQQGVHRQVHLWIRTVPAVRDGRDGPPAEDAGVGGGADGYLCGPHSVARA